MPPHIETRNRAIRFVTFFLLLSTPQLAAQQRCGGTERWQVKVGADPDANHVDLSNPVPISLHDLIRLPQPQLPPQHDNETRLSAERTVYVVRGRLVKFKLESGRTGDQDYHLVVADDSLAYSPPGHSVVAEIVKPECVPGQKGDPNVPSRFESQIAAVRAKFDAKFPDITGGWNETGGIPVTITGVGFFDRPHGQTGRALNNIELHPVLDIAFDNEAPTDVTGSTAAGPAPAIQNPGFEKGSQEWSASADVITDDSNEPARTGKWKAWLGGYGTKHTDSLSQTVVIPASADHIALSFYLHVSTEEDNDQQQAYDTLKFQVRSSTGTVLKTLATYSNLNAGSGFQRKSVDLTEFKGKTIRLHFVCKEDGRSLTSFVLDDFKLTVEH